MTSRDVIPEACEQALAALEADALDLPPEVAAHLRGCAACAEARVLMLALEEDPQVLAPSGYFERLPDRVVRKLPRPAARRGRPVWLAAAAALLAAVGGFGFWAGRLNRTPLVEAHLPKAPAEIQEPAPDLPFQDMGEDAAQVQDLSPEEIQALVQRLESTRDARPASRPAPASKPASR